ncbi:MAG: hypothetical protein V1820_00470 [archaeon]
MATKKKPSPKGAAPSGASLEKKRKKSNLPNLLTGFFMILAGLAFTLTGIGAIVGLPLFLVGIVLTGFFFLKERRESAERL